MDFSKFRIASGNRRQDNGGAQEMVTELLKNSKKFYICDACGFAYEQKEQAQKCQRWCEEHNSCNLELTKYAVPLETD